jgi:hypothetical protein
MPSVAGSFRIAGPGTTFWTNFVIDEITHSFQGTLGGTSVEPCDGVVTLTYDDPGQLTSTRDFSGIVGRTTTKITVANGVEIAGPLNNPISIANNVTGTGRWGVTKFDS